MKFCVEQIAINPPDPKKAEALLKMLGLEDWVHDHVVAKGDVYGEEGKNEADLAFNYQATAEGKPLEFEILSYTDGPNWMTRHQPAVSHLGMHCTGVELAAWREKFAQLGIGVAQEVNTVSHTNPAIKGLRLYTYAIFDTRAILGVDLKFIVRHMQSAPTNVPPAARTLAQAEADRRFGQPHYGHPVEGGTE